MENINLFEIATRKRFRFESNMGLVSVEDLWPMKKDYLEAIADCIDVKLDKLKGSRRQRKMSAEREELQLKLDIVEYIIEYKEQQENERKTKAQAKEELELYKTLIMDKKHEELKGMSLEDLQKKVTQLQETM